MAYNPKHWDAIQFKTIGTFELSKNYIMAPEKQVLVVQETHCAHKNFMNFSNIVGVKVQS